MNGEIAGKAYSTSPKAESGGVIIFVSPKINVGGVGILEGFAILGAGLACEGKTLVM